MMIDYHNSATVRKKQYENLGKRCVAFVSEGEGGGTQVHHTCFIENARYLNLQGGVVGHSVRRLCRCNAVDW